jgi:thioredoxin 2
MSRFTADERGVVVTCPGCRQNNRWRYERLGEAPRCAKCGTELSLPNEPIDIPDEAAFAAFTQRSALPVLVDFWAEWCGPCKMVAPELAKVAAESAGRWLVAKVNTEELPGPSQRFQIRGIPTFVLFKGGREAARQSGAMPATAIRNFLLTHLEPSTARRGA